MTELNNGYQFILMGKVKYQEAWDFQKERVRLLDEEAAPESVILLEHPHTITLGSAGKEQHLLLSEERLKQRQIDYVPIDRGGDITYHGPGQCVGYPILYLGKLDAHSYLRNLEESIILTLQDYGIESGRKLTYTGVWVKDEKIAAIGVKFNKCRHRKGYITSHGFALNVTTDLTMFDTIVPCGIQEYGVTSMQKLLGLSLSMEEVKQRWNRRFQEVFERTVLSEATIG